MSDNKTVGWDDERTLRYANGIKAIFARGFDTPLSHLFDSPDFVILPETSPKPADVADWEANRVIEAVDQLQRDCHYVGRAGLLERADGVVGEDE